MTWQGIALGFLIGFLTWPMGTVVMTLVDMWRSRMARLSYRKYHESEREQYEKDKALGVHAMTVDEWESYYGPLPTDREMLS